MSCRSRCQLTGSSQLCVARLNTRFPDSPRVASLQGMLIESAGELGKALTFYEGILAKDETNLVSANASRQICNHLTLFLPHADDCQANGRRAQVHGQS